MRNLLSALAAASLTFCCLIAAGFAAAPILIPDPPNIYRTGIYDITLPKDWTCKIVVTESVCRPTGTPERALLIASMKYRDKEMDTLDAYIAYLMTPKTMVLRNGKQLVSKIEHVGRTVIEGRTWADGTHFESEVPNYQTRYLATTTAQIAILITFSSEKNYFTTYQPMFEQMVRGLNIYQRYDSAIDAPPR